MQSIKVPQLESWEKMAGISIHSNGEFSHWVIFSSLQLVEKTYSEHIEAAKLISANVATKEEVDMCLNTYPYLQEKINKVEGMILVETQRAYTSDSKSGALYVRRVYIEDSDEGVIPPVGPGSLSLPLTEQRLNAGGN